MEVSRTGVSDVWGPQAREKDDNQVLAHLSTPVPRLHLWQGQGAALLESTILSYEKR